MKNRLFWFSILLICILLGWKNTSLLLIVFGSLALQAVLLIAAIFLVLLGIQHLRNKHKRLKAVLGPKQPKDPT